MIPITSIIQKADKSWVFTWPSQGANFYRVVLWGITLAKTTALTFTWHGQEYQTYPPPLEIAFEDTKVTSEQFLPYLVMQWYGEPQAQTYQVQSYDGASWSTISIIQETGEWIYTYRTVILRDENLYTYQVIAFDRYGNQSQPRQYNIYIVTPPIPVDGKVLVSYSSGNVVVSAV